MRYRSGLIVWVSLLLILSGQWFTLARSAGNVDYYRVALARTIYAQCIILLNQIYSVLPGEQVLSYYLGNREIMLFGGVAVLGSFMACRLAIYANRSL